MLHSYSIEWANPISHRDTAYIKLTEPRSLDTYYLRNKYFDKIVKNKKDRNI